MREKIPNLEELEKLDAGMNMPLGTPAMNHLE
jgi:hypothetical protein